MDIKLYVMCLVSLLVNVVLYFNYFRGPLTGGGGGALCGYCGVLIIKKQFRTDVMFAC